MSFLGSQPADLRYSFSGADCTAYAFYPGQTILWEYIEKTIEEYENYIMSIQAGFKRSADDPNEYVIDSVGQIGRTPIQDKLTQTEADLAAAQKIVDTGVDQFGVAVPPSGIKQFKKNIRRYKKIIRRLADPVKKEREERKGFNGEVKRLEAGIEDLKKVQAKYTGGDFAKLDSLATISISIHEPKGMARTLGKRNITGLSRSVRTIAGTMIFVVVDNHPLAKLMALDPQQVLPLGIKYGWDPLDLHRGMRDKNMGVGAFQDPENKRKSWIRTPTDLSPFVLILDYMSEYQGGNFMRNTSIARSEGQKRISEIQAQLVYLDNEERKLKGEKKSSPKKERKIQALLDFDIERRLQDIHEERVWLTNEFKEIGKPGGFLQQKPSAKNETYKANLKVQTVLEDVEFISQGTVTSVNDMVTEVSVQFIASNVYEMHSGLPEGTNVMEFNDIAEIMSRFAYREDIGAVQGISRIKSTGTTFNNGLNRLNNEKIVAGDVTTTIDIAPDMPEYVDYKKKQGAKRTTVLPGDSDNWDQRSYNQNEDGSFKNPPEDWKNE